MLNFNKPALEGANAAWYQYEWQNSLWEADRKASTVRSDFTKLIYLYVMVLSPVSPQYINEPLHFLGHS
jgi:hypothetical protein